MVFSRLWKHTQLIWPFLKQFYVFKGWIWIHWIRNITQMRCRKRHWGKMCVISSFFFQRHSLCLDKSSNQLPNHWSIEWHVSTKMKTHDFLWSTQVKLYNDHKGNAMTVRKWQHSRDRNSVPAEWLQRNTNPYPWPTAHLLRANW